VVRGEKSMAQYKKELYGKYRGNYAPKGGVGESGQSPTDYKSLSNEELLKQLEGK
jgi:hypothetical protein